GYQTNPVAVVRPQDVLVQQTTGELTAPPANAAVIQVQVPNDATQVQIDGVRTTSLGTTRFYATPELATDKTFTYTITATFERNGQPVPEERRVEVTAGKTSVVNFNRPVPR